MKDAGRVKTLARVTGGLFLLAIVLGGIGESFQGRFLVPGNAAATAQRIAARPELIWMGIAAFLVEMPCQTAMTALFYSLLKPVNRPLSFVAACVGLVGIAVKTMSRLFFLAPLFVLGGSAGYLGVFTDAQREALALFLLNLSSQGTGMAMPFFGFYAILNGWLVFRSRFLPRVLGLVGMAGGLGWLAFLYRPLADQWVGAILGVAILASAAKIFWLLVFGVDEKRWQEQASG